MADAEITVELKDKITAKIKEISDLFDKLDKEVDLSNVDAEIEDVAARLRKLDRGVDLGRIDTEIEDVAARLRKLGPFAEAAINSINSSFEKIDTADAVSELGKVSSKLRGVISHAAAAASEVRSLAREIAKLKSKTIVITIIRRTVYRTAGGTIGQVVGAAAGSNPYSEGAGRPTLSAAQAKDFTERVTLPALKTLAREGKVEEVVP